MSATGAVIFDLDGTLCEFERSSDEVLAATFEQLGLDQPFDMQAFHAGYTEFLQKAADARELYERCFEKLANEAGLEPGTGERITETFLAERDLAAVHPTPGAHAMVEAVRDRQPVGLVTNGHPDIQWRKLRAIDLADRFDVVVFAGYETPAKPATEPFDVAIEELAVDRAESLYVGNVPGIDVRGARAAGLRTALVANGEIAETFDPDYHVGSLEELLERLG